MNKIKVSSGRAAEPRVRARKLTARAMNESNTAGIKLAELVAGPSDTTMLERHNLAELSSIRRVIVNRKVLTA